MSGCSPVSPGGHAGRVTPRKSLSSSPLLPLSSSPLLPSATGGRCAATYLRSTRNCCTRIPFFSPTGIGAIPRMVSPRPHSSADLFAGQPLRPREPFDEFSSRRNKVPPSRRQGYRLTDTSWHKVLSPGPFLAKSFFFQAIRGTTFLSSKRFVARRPFSGAIPDTMSYSGFLDQRGWGRGNGRVLGRDPKVPRRSARCLAIGRWGFAASGVSGSSKPIRSAFSLDIPGRPAKDRQRTGSPGAVARPGLPQTRTCAINAFGSSSYPFATRRHTE